jgi:hypothetical protein
MMTKRCGRAVLAILVLAIVATAALGAENYSWQKPHAKVVPTGDLEWAPEPFALEKGESVRYIDFEAGDDAADGTSPETAWKHHPWDAAAKGNAADCTGIHTYVFKGGVVYRGTLTAKESGKPGDPIRLTRDPAWGQGPARLWGSARITGAWKRCTPADAPKYMPDPAKVWMIELPKGTRPWALWELRGDDVLRVPICREPNWTVSFPDDPQKEWYEWTAWERGKGAGDKARLAGKPADFFDGGYVWTEWSGNMGTIHIGAIKGYDPATGRIRGHNGRKGNRYYIEGVPGYLDAPGEHYFDEKTGRLYVRLDGDRDPNDAVLEIARRPHMIDIQDQSHIVVSGFEFRFNNLIEPGTGWPPATAEPTCVRVAGDCRDVEVGHSRFHHVMSVLNAHPRMNAHYTKIYLRNMMPWRQDRVDDVRFTDNDIAFADRPAVTFAEGRMLQRVEYPPYGTLGRISVLRNRFDHVGSRPGGNIYTAIPALAAYFPEQAEIAGNILNQCWGSGIFVFGGKASGEIGEVPLTRILIHHNKVTNAMLACNDYGGIEYWQGGPIYAWSNISGNSIGYKHYVPLKNDWKTVAYNVYLDGTFKSYTFNNIIWGKSNDPNYPYRNRGGYFVVLGFMDHLFNNTICKFRHGIVGSSGNRCSFLGNVVADVSGQFIQQNRRGDTSLRGGGDTGEMGLRGMSTNAYGYNVFSGKNVIGNAGVVRGTTVEDWRKDLEKLGARCTQVGWRVDEPVLVDGDKHDFRPRPGSAAADRGVTFFVPWSLYGMVGEWNFCKSTARPDLVLGENYFMTAGWLERHMYDLVPRNDLDVPGAKPDDYVKGTLEDWTDGALRFDGKTRFCVLPHKELARDFTVGYAVDTKQARVGKGKTVIPAAERKTVDMGANSFLVELVFRTDPGHTGGVLISKMAGGVGYEVRIGKAGTVEWTVSAGPDARTTQGAPAKVNDGAWHHVILEVDRPARTMQIYVDGKSSGKTGDIAPMPQASISNAGDFLVGRAADGRFFAGALDFLRVSRGTLADARTTIEELYAWQFDGPQFRDFTGEKPADGKRDAGAIEAR